MSARVGSGFLRNRLSVSIAFSTSCFCPGSTLFPATNARSWARTALSSLICCIATPSPTRSAGAAGERFPRRSNVEPDDLIASVPRKTQSTDRTRSQMAAPDRRVDASVPVTRTVFCPVVSCRLPRVATAKVLSDPWEVPAVRRSRKLSKNYERSYRPPGTAFHRSWWLSSGVTLCKSRLGTRRGRFSF